MGEKLLGYDDTSWDSQVIASRVYISQFTAAKTGTVSEIHINANGSGHVMVAIYSNNANAPNTLLASSASTAVVSGWNIIAISDVNVTSGQNYWLAINSDDAIVNYIVSSGAANNKIKATATYATYTFPDPAGSSYSSNTSYKLAFAGWSVGGGVPLLVSGLVGSNNLLKGVLL